MRDLLGEFQDEGVPTQARLVETSIGETKELQRVRDLPRRVWQDDPRLPELIQALTSRLRYNHNTCQTPCEGCKAKEFKPAQAVALRETYNQRGSFPVLRVGAGKTLTGFSIPAVFRLMGRPEGERPLLVVPGSAQDDTRRYHQEHSRHWKLPPLTLVSYQLLSHPKHVDWLNQYKPTLIVFDEAHKLKDPRSKVSKRLKAYLNANPGTICVFMTGSAAGRSLLEYAHYLPWALHANTPVPRDQNQAGLWALATDPDIADEARVDPGALLQLGTYPAEAEPVVQARRAYQDRFTSTPGVISTLEDIPPVGLKLWTTELKMPLILRKHVEHMRKTWQTPDGQDFASGTDLYRHSVTLGAGLFMRWDPPAPKEWMEARREWNKFGREWLQYQRKYDSLVHCANLIDAGKLDDGGVLAAWREIEPTFKPNPVPVWVDLSALEYAKAWLEREQGLVWVAQHEAGVKLSELSGAPFFAEGALDAAGRNVSACSGPMIVSMHSCREQKNLQYAHYKNLLLTVPPRGDWLEQLFGRTHRDGQPEHEVTGEILLSTRESYLSLAKCVRDAQADWERHGQPRKLAYANRDFGFVEHLLAGADPDGIPGP